LKKSVLELGGSDPFIVLEDADLELAVSGAIRTRLSNSGQACAAGKRFIVHRSRAGEFEERFATALGEARLGNPEDPTTQVGPLARPDLLDILERQVRTSVDMGARVVVGGRRRPEFGCAFEPTLLADCTSDMPVLREETFGPVAAMIDFEQIEDAIRLANDTPFGLGATIWSKDHDKALEVAKEIQAGTVVINGIVTSDPRVPFGGVKQSGYGREQSKFGIREFVNIQTLVGG
jgi:succinate-semialdehyde dehydrogenase/glutarate-semialdehyde dehydrogenase